MFNTLSNNIDHDLDIILDYIKYNAVEGWHDRFNRHVGCHHANIWKLIEVLKNDEDISRIELLHIQQGRVQQNANPVYARINARVNTVVNDYANRGHLDYLRGIAYNITV